MADVSKIKLNGTTYNVKDVTARNTAAEKYTKPSTGIPKTDLESSVQTSLGKADSAIQNLSGLGITATAAELNTLDGITATVTELNYTDGVTSNIQTQLNEKAASSHTHSEYVNQNAFSNITVGSTTIAADSTTDTVTFAAGSNITLTPDATNDKLIIAATDTTYSPGTGISLSGTTFSNSGVRSVGTGSTNGTISVNTNGTSTDVAVKGLGSNAYTSTTFIPATEKGSASGVATLGTDGKVPSNQLPSYVDDVIEGYYNNGKFYSDAAHTQEITGESNKIYVSLDTNKIYRYSGSTFVVVSETLALGETSSTAYYGDKGKTAYDHSQITSGNPHGITKTTVGLSNVENKSSETIRGELTLANINSALSGATISISDNIITFS